MNEPDSGFMEYDKPQRKNIFKRNWATTGDGFTGRNYSA
jgi:hypothetical protein